MHCSVLERLTVLADEMTEKVSVESQRLGAWVVLKEGTGAQLLCPATGSVLSREDIICETFSDINHVIQT